MIPNPNLNATADTNAEPPPVTYTLATAEGRSAWAAFDKTTSRWGRITMIIAMILMIGGPAIVAARLGVDPLWVIGAVLSIAAVFGVIWFVEPLSYFPILGPASMYQAFMIGNISNKLLPAAIVAQSTIGVRPETKKGQLSAVLAICGAAITHLTSLAIFVGLLGTLLISAIPPEIVASIQTYVLPAIMGAVVVQMIASNPQPRILIIAVTVGLIVTLVLTPLFPVMAYFNIAVAVLATILLALFLPGGKSAPAAEDEALEDIS